MAIFEATAGEYYGWPKGPKVIINVKNEQTLIKINKESEIDIKITQK